jgi:hypothetical protein
MAAVANALTSPAPRLTRASIVPANSSTSCAVWFDWNFAYVTASATSSVTTSSASNVIVWASWNDGYSGASTETRIVTGAGDTWGSWNLVAQETEDARRQREAQTAAARALREKTDAIARDLLLKHLRPEQRKQFEAQRSFEVIGQSGKRRYLIESNGLVKRIDDKGPVESYCIHPDFREHPQLPVPDLILAKKLMLECDEDRFLKTANATRLRA